MNTLQHLFPGFVVTAAILVDTRKIFDGGFQCPEGEDVGHRIASLVCRTQDRIGGTGGALSITIAVETENGVLNTTTYGIAV
jgi:hypothetical protein